MSAAVRPATVLDAPAMARLHAELLPEGFLPLLGVPFLERLYRRVVRSESAFGFVTDRSPGDVSGFVAAALDTRRLYREFIRHDGFGATIAAAPRVIRHPRRVYETLRYGAGDEPDHTAEILSIAVALDGRGKGLGVALVEAALTELKRRGVPAARVVTASGNEVAQRMYVACGFHPHSTVEVHRGVTQQVLAWP